MNFQEALDYLNSYINYEKNLHEISPTLFRLERVQRVLQAIGEPQKKLRFVHVAGTKGKGSTCAMVANILKHQGYRVGLFTSPHINNVRERIRILEKGKIGGGSDDIFPDAISEADVLSVVQALKDKLDRFREDEALGNLTYFEVLTAAALYYFSLKKCDIVVLETGLGGRLDATNSVHTLVCGITPISMEHMHLLGDTLDKIAYEKAAIIKNARQKVVVAPQEAPAMDVLIKRCNEFDLKPVIIGKDIKFKLKDQDYRRITFDLRTPEAEYKDLILGLAGRHQLLNASLAVGIIEALRLTDFKISKEAIVDGLKDIQWPGRFEVLQESPLLIVDGAHNKASAKALVETIKEVLPGRKIHLIFGASQLKDIKGMCQELNRVATTVIGTRSNHPRVKEFTPDELRTYFPGKKGYLTGDIDEALKIGRKMQQSGDVLLGTGSLYLVSELRERCTSLRI